MIALSILLKSYALYLYPLVPLASLVGWLLGAALDLRIFHTRAPTRSSAWRATLSVQAATLLMGIALWALVHHGAMVWKTGFPGASAATAGLFRFLGLPASGFGGTVHLTTMGGALDVTPSLDQLGMLIPLSAGCLGMVYLLHLARGRKNLLVRMGVLFAVLGAAALLRFILSTALFVALCDFVGYETEDVPWSPFVRSPWIAASYLPFLLAAAPLLSRLFPPARTASLVPISAVHPSAWQRVAWVVLPLLCLAAFWNPRGTPKSGALVISTYHTQWSRTDRPYDRSWYGADSGYNYAVLKRWFETFFPVRTLTGRIKAEDLADASVLMLYIPDRPFSEQERSLIETFVRNGGGLFVIGDHTNVFGSSTHLNTVVRPFGFQFRDDVLFDLDDDFFQLIDVPRITPPMLHGMSTFKLRGPASIQPTRPGVRSILGIGHSKALRAIYSVNNFYPPPHDHPRMRTGYFSIATATRYGQGRIAAFADSTIFSNFEIFYPGKYELLLNTANWLNHRDGPATTLVQRISLLGALGLALFLLLQSRNGPTLVRRLTLLMVLGGCAWGCARLAENARSTYPSPIRPARSLFFLAGADDPTYRLRTAMGEENYRKKWDVFIQWVLRTDTFSGFCITDPNVQPDLYHHLMRASGSGMDAGLAWIIHRPEDLQRLPELTERFLVSTRRSMLLFSSQFSWEAIEPVLRRADLLSTQEEVDQARTAWSSGSHLVDKGSRRILLVAEAERFSDQEMGISEKGIPDAVLQERFTQAFDLVDLLFANPAGGAP